MKTVSFVIKVLKEFEDLKVTEFEGITRDEAVMLAILIIKDIPEYAGYKEEELRTFEIKNYETILTKYAQDLANAGQDVPENIKILVDDLEKNKPEFETQVKSQIDELKQTEALTDQIRITSSEPVYFNKNTTEQIKKVAQSNPKKLTNIISRRLQLETKLPETKANDIAESYTNYLKDSKEDQVIATAVSREPEATLQIPSGGFYLAGPTIASYGLKEIAKDEPKLATALVLSSQKVNDLQRLGMDPQIVKLYFDELKHIQESGGKIDWISKNIAAQGLLTTEQVQIINNAGNSINYSTFNQAFAAPVHGSVFNTVLNNVGQQVFGKLAKNFIKNKIGGEALKKVTGSILGVAIPGVGGVLGNIALDLGLKVLSFTKKYIVPIFVGFGAVVGGALFGGAGVIGGGAIGAIAAGGISGGSMASGIATVTGGVAALGGAFAAAIVAPLLIAIIGIPIAVAFILFIINSGAYVVPPAGNIGLNGGKSNPHSCYVLDSSWVEPYKTKMMDAINQVSQAGFFMDKLCAKGNVTLMLSAHLYSTIYSNPDGTPVEINGYVPGSPARIIHISQRGIDGGAFETLYLLSHESGHVLSQVTNLQQVFVDTPSTHSEVPDCTYFQANHYVGEDFAEMVGRYITEPTRKPSTQVWLCSTVNSTIIRLSTHKTWKDSYPNTWKFAHDKIFEENLGW
jgi:hypothetical protein